MGEIGIYLAKFSEGIRRKTVKRTGGGYVNEVQMQIVPLQ
jgi:hypothetical protein